ncbi:MAG: aldehyde ferredoxin oxidoreductase C-terminal domain-containing protein, partial [Promethearchaeota archaeon]
GRANEPVYLTVIDGEVEIRDASSIWGLDTLKTENAIKERHGNGIKIASIGRAGELCSLIAGVVNDGGRVAARSGLGAVMGSKKLKLLALKGNHRVNYHDKKKFFKLVKLYNQRCGARGESRFAKILNRLFIPRIPSMGPWIRRFKISMNSSSVILTRLLYKKFGTTTSNIISIETGDAPVRNWNGIGYLEFPITRSSKIGADAIDKYRIRSYGCSACPIRCGAILRVPELGIDETHRPEYETCTAFGPNVLNDDLLTLLKLNDLCNLSGLDTISTGATVAFAIECFKAGILKEKDTSGLKLDWGDSKSILELVMQIINRKGAGELLADGVKIAAQKLGKKSNNYAIHSRGQEIPMHNPRVFKSLALTYAYDPTPGRHTAASVDFIDMGPIDDFLKGFTLPPRWQQDLNQKAKAQMLITKFHQGLNGLGLCLFSTLFGRYPLLELVNNLTGWDMTVEEFLEIGWRIQTMRQAFTLREGINIVATELHGRVVGEPPHDRGPLKGMTVEYREFYKKTCEHLGWDPETGYPLKETLSKLGLTRVIKDLYE